MSITFERKKDPVILITITTYNKYDFYLALCKFECDAFFVSRLSFWRGKFPSDFRKKNHQSKLCLTSLSTTVNLLYLLEVFPCRFRTSASTRN